MGLIKKATATINQANNIIVLADTTGVYNGISNPEGYGSPNRSNSNTITDIIITKPDGTTVTLRNNIALTDPTQLQKLPVLPATQITKTITPTDLGFTNNTPPLPIGIYKLDYYTWYRLDGTGFVGNAGRTEVNHSAGRFTNELTGFGTSAKWIKVIEQGHAYEANSRIASVISDGVVSLDTALPNQPYFAINSVLSIYAGFLATSYLLADAELLACFNPKVARLSTAPKDCCKQCGHTDVDTLIDIMLGIKTAEIQFELGLYEDSNRSLQSLYKTCMGGSCGC